MSRQYQALQISLIIFAMLTIVLGVTTYLSLHTSAELRVEAKTAHEAADKGHALALQAQQDAGELKTLLGFKADEKLDAIQQQAAADMQFCASTLPESCRTYRGALAAVHDAVVAGNREVASGKHEIKSLADAMEHRETGSQAQIDQFRTSNRRLGAQAVTVEKTANDELARAKENLRGIERTLDKVQAETRQKVADARQQVEELQGKCKDLAQENERLKKQQDESQASSVTQGHIVRVSAQLRTAWIDLGSADGVRQLLPFNVYPATAAKLNTTTQKGMVRVSNVPEAHMAEAKIVEDNPADPLVPRDKVHSPGWKPSGR
jgi:hypothetical protein